MKQLKKGFSLSELLIALAIISIISVLGITISKKGMEKAYNQYIYNAYSSIQYAIADARNQGHTIDSNNVNNCEFTKHIIKKVFHADWDSPSLNKENNVSFTTKNGVKYYIEYRGTAPGYNDYYLIQVTVPTMTKKVNGKVKSTLKFSLCYAPEQLDILVPYPNISNTESTDYKPTNEIDLQNRKDLLPFYIDDGETGYYVQECTTVENSTDTCVMQDKPKPLNDDKPKRQFMSFKEAFCKRYGNKSTEESQKDYVATVKCSNNPSQDYGTIRVADPRKVF